MNETMTDGQCTWRIERMVPQPLCEFWEVKANNRWEWVHWTRGEHPDDCPKLLNQPKYATGVYLNPKTRIWYWLLDT